MASYANHQFIIKKSPRYMLTTGTILQVNLGQIIDVYAIGTQGKEGASQWVKTYRLQYTENFLESNYINYFENNVIKVKSF